MLVEALYQSVVPGVELCVGFAYLKKIRKKQISTAGSALNADENFGSWKAPIPNVVLISVPVSTRAMLGGSRVQKVSPKQQVRFDPTRCRLLLALSY